ALHERLQDSAGTHPTNVLDLSAADRLPIGDDRQRLERRARESGGDWNRVESLEHIGVLRPRQQLIPARDLDDVECATLRLVLVPQLGDELLDLVLVKRFVYPRQVRRRERRIAREQQ